MEKADSAKLAWVLLAFCVLTAAASSAQTLTTLYSFCSQPNCTDGSAPWAGLTRGGPGTFYGTTWSGGDSGWGTVFELSRNSSGDWTETVLHSFTGGADGGGPRNAYIMLGKDGSLYGTACYGGSGQNPGNGVVFGLTRVNGSWTETVLYAFAGGADGGNPVGGLIMDKAGNIFGTTFKGGNDGLGVVFELSRSGDVWTEQPIFSPPSGTSDAGLTMDAEGNIFGLAAQLIFELSPTGSGWNPNVIYTFNGVGYQPEGRLVLGKDGNLYGTTESGGPAGGGSVFELSPRKNGRWSAKTLHPFKINTAGGNAPYGGVVFDDSGNIYGTTTEANNSGNGVVYELLAPVGKGGYKEKILWSFNGQDGALPYSTLILENPDKLYGTAFGGGPNDGGSVFEVTP